jgi:hypothetical protein
MITLFLKITCLVIENTTYFLKTNFWYPTAIQCLCYSWAHITVIFETRVYQTMAELSQVSATLLKVAGQISALGSNKPARQVK